MRIRTARHQACRHPIAYYGPAGCRACRSLARDAAHARATRVERPVGQPKRRAPRGVETRPGRPLARRRPMSRVTARLATLGSRRMQAGR